MGASYVADHGAPSHRGRVEAVPGALSRCSRFVPPPQMAGAQRRLIRSVHTDPDGTRIVVRTATEAIVYEPYGGRRFEVSEPDRDLTVACEHGLVHGGTLHPWTRAVDRSEPGVRARAARRQLAAAVVGDAFVTAANQRRPFAPARLWTGGDALDPDVWSQGWLGRAIPPRRSPSATTVAW